MSVSPAQANNIIEVITIYDSYVVRCNNGLVRECLTGTRMKISGQSKLLVSISIWATVYESI